MIMGGGRLELSPDDWIVAVVQECDDKCETKWNLMNFHENLVNFHDNYDNENSEIITKKLYVDIIQIFLYLLQLFGRSD